MVSVFILIIASISSGVFSEWAFNSIYVVLVVILPTLVSVACKFDNFKSLPLAWRSNCPHISGFTFGVINRSQFAGQRYFPHLSLRFELSSLLSHLKFMIFASLSKLWGQFSPFRIGTVRFCRVKIVFISAIAACDVVTFIVCSFLLLASVG